MKMSFISITTLSLATGLVLSGCADATNQRLDSMNNQMDKLNKRVESYQDHVEALDNNSSRIAKETEAYEQLLKSLANQAERIAGSLEQFQKMGESFSQQLQGVAKGGSNDKADGQTNPSNEPPTNKTEGLPNKGSASGANTSAAVRAEPQGSQIRLDEAFCVTKNVHTLYDQITNYDGYSKMPGSKYNITGIGPLIQMVSSDAEFSARTAQYSTADTAIVLQPITLTEAKLFPRLTIHCDSKWGSDNVFEHQCFLDQSKAKFGLSNLISHLKAEAGACQNGQTRVTYQLSLQTSETEVLAIKNRVVTNFKVLGPIVAKFFNEELFFKAYFRNLYNSWIKTGN